MSFDIKCCKMPILLSCGHTFEKEDIDKKKCPSCKEPYYIIGPNWTIIEYMKLDVKILKHDDIKNRVRDNVKKYRVSKYEQDIKISNYHIPKIVNRIRNRSLLGYNFTIYKPSLFYGFSENVYKLIEKKFKQNGFFVGKCIAGLGIQIYISWYSFQY